MIRPSDEEIAAAKKAAGAKGAELYEFTYDDPDVDACVLATGMSADDFAAFWDVTTRNSDDGRDGVYRDHVVWPAPDKADELAERIPALASLVAKDLQEIAGKVDDVSPTEFKLHTATPTQLQRAGISEAAAKTMREDHAGPLTVVHFADLDMSTPGKGFSVVMKVPPRPIFRAKLAAYAAARASLSGIWESACAAVRDAIVWTSEGASPDPIFARYPGVPAVDLIYTFQRIGGGLAKGERRRL